MAELKQIEVNGSTYDIGIPGSAFPVICEVYQTNWTGDTILDKMNGSTPFNVQYQEISSNMFLKTVSSDTEGQNNYSVVIAVSDAAIS